MSNNLLRVLVLCAAAAVFVRLVLIVATPRNLFSDPYSTLLYSREGELLGARIAPDGQWRFPQSDSLPERFVKSMVTFEDKRFFYHPGVDPAAVVRALKQNISSGSVVSGGSTITMQLARVARGNRDRNIWEKLIEALWAFSIEARFSKREILNLYASHAPFGGNAVGIEAASWRYFGRPPYLLSWAECATLAVLPNSPSLIHPGRNRDRLRDKRDGLLRKLLNNGYIDRDEYELACMEPLPDAPVPLPDDAPHLMTRLSKDGTGSRLQTSVEANLQRQAQSVVNRYVRQYESNHVHNIAVIIARVETGEVLAYVGNTTLKADARFGNDVDVVASPRSTGSVLKPLLYAGMLHDGLILPSTLIADTPLNIKGYTPQNYTRTYYGAVPANRAIERSLNVPLVRMLSMYNTGRFMSLLKSLGMTTLRFSEDHYGAAIILGGAEGTLWDMAGIYASMSRTLNHFGRYNGRYDKRDIHPLSLELSAPSDEIRSVTDGRLSDNPLLSAASIWFAYEAMSSVNRPEEEAEWQQFSSMKRVAWKTGTSYGGRDAWAVGTTPQYVVGVWVGNASGEGRAGLTGVSFAAPVLFDLFGMLPGGGWFDMPLDEMERVPVCRRSGHKATGVCEPVDTLYIPHSGLETDPCKYHRRVHLSEDGNYRVDRSCETADNMATESWFVLPPAQEYYYKNYNFDYRALPPWRAGCGTQAGRGQIDLIYPEHNMMLYLPRGFSGEYEKFVFKAAHARADATIYWSVGDRFLGETYRKHSIDCQLEEGQHVLTLTDDMGNQRRIMFEVRRSQ